MIGSLRGIIDTITSDSLLLDVGGVGYQVYCSANTLRSLPGASEAAKLYIETHVREDHIHLYGFHAEEEQQAFQTLIRVNGVGARMALAILSGLTPAQLSVALAAQDTKAFTAISGVGPKLASRILNELKDKWAISAQSLEINHTANTNTQQESSTEDTLLALTQLGYSRSDAYQVVQKVTREHPALEVNDLIKHSLQLLSRA